MIDRELLKLAATAAGYSFNNIYHNPQSGLLVWEPPSNYESRDWNPLTDNADAFALMVTLGLVVHVGSDAARALYDGEGCTEEYSGDKAASTRRAIVRAAAEIGARK